GSHAFAMKSQIWLLDPRPNLPSIVQAVEKGFELSEASNTPVMLELRIRACHVYGSFVARDNTRRAFTLKDALEHPVRDTNRVVLPPASYLHEREKVEKRWPAAVRFIEQHKLNDVFDGDAGDIGIVMQGGMYNAVPRAHVSSCAPRLLRHKPYPALRAQHHLPADRRRVHPLLREQESRSDRGGRSAGIHRAGGEHDPAPRRCRNPRRGQEHAADGG